MYHVKYEYLELQRQTSDLFFIKHMTEMHIVLCVMFLVVSGSLEFPKWSPKVNDE